MIPFNGFEQILMAVIRETLHSDDMDRSGKLRKTDEERFDEAMTAIFGDNYEPCYQKTASFSGFELMRIDQLNKSGKSFRASVREVVIDRLPDHKGTKYGKKQQDDALLPYLEQAKKHFKKYKEHYDQAMPIYFCSDIQNSEHYSEEDKLLYIKQRENIFNALRKADWVIS